MPDGLELVAMMVGGRKSSFALVFCLPTFLRVGERMQGLGQTFGEVLMLDFKVEKQECGVGFLWTPAHVGVEWRQTEQQG